MICDRLGGQRFIRLMLAIFFLLISGSAAADKSRPEDAVNSDDRSLLSKMVDNLISAWNKNDPEAIAKLFLPNGVLVTPTGSVIRSRSEIRKRINHERQGS
jgi:hypothetical protein